MRATRLGWAAAAVLASAGAASATEVGEPAPEIDVTAWVQGAPITLAEGVGKKVFLIEVWATFEQDCIDAVGRLDGLYDKYKAQGFEIIAITTEPADDVKKFLADHKCGYRVATDQDRNTVGVWAKDLRKYPMAWLVDRTGLVVWKGDLSNNRFGNFVFNPDGSFTFNSGGGSLEDMLPDVVSGKYDHKKQQEREKRRTEMNEAQWKRDWDAVASLADKALAEDPQDTSAYDHRVGAYRGKNDVEGFRKFVRGYVERAKEDAKTLRHVAQQLSGGAYEWRDIDLSLTLAKRAVDASKSADASILGTYAGVLQTVGLLEQAIEVQKKVVALEGKDESHKKLLAFYEQCLAVKKKAGAPTKK